MARQEKAPETFAVTAKAVGPHRSRKVDRADVLDAALRLVTAEGLASLTMRRLAEELEVGLGTVHAAAESKEAVLAALVEVVLAKVPEVRVDPETWQGSLVELVVALHEVFVAHPEIARLAVLQRITGPVALQMQETMLALLRAGGLGEEASVLAYTELVSFVVGFTLLRLSRTEFEGQAGEPQLDRWLRQFPSAMFPHVRALGPQLATQTSPENFVRGVNALLATFG